MRRYLRDSLSPSMAVALLALALTLSGTGYAAVHLSGGGGTVARSAQPVLRSGETMRGYFAGGAGDSTSGFFGEGITFPKKLPSSFHSDHVKYLSQADPFTSKCPGPGRAKRGWMCFYEGQLSEASLCCIYDQDYDSLAVAPYGARIYWDVEGSGSFADGQWVVRAP